MRRCGRDSGRSRLLLRSSHSFSDRRQTDGQGTDTRRGVQAHPQVARTGAIRAHQRGARSTISDDPQSRAGASRHLRRAHQRQRGRDDRPTDRPPSRESRHQHTAGILLVIAGILEIGAAGDRRRRRAQHSLDHPAAGRRPARLGLFEPRLPRPQDARLSRWRSRSSSCRCFRTRSPSPSRCCSCSAASLGGRPDSSSVGRWHGICRRRCPSHGPPPTSRSAKAASYGDSRRPRT